ncbi:integrating conjugative element protein, partial [Escherichia coli]
EPNAMLQDDALAEGERRIEALDREIAALKNEMELKRELARNSVLTIIERENERVVNNPMIQQTDNADSRMHTLEAPDEE